MSTPRFSVTTKPRTVPFRIVGQSLQAQETHEDVPSPRFTVTARPHAAVPLHPAGHSTQVLEATEEFSLHEQASGSRADIPQPQPYPAAIDVPQMQPEPPHREPFEAQADERSPEASGEMSWMFACLAGSFVTLSLLIGTAGYFILNTGEMEALSQETPERSAPTAPQDDNPGIQSSAEVLGGANPPTSTAVVCYWNSSSIMRSPPKDYDLSKLCVHCCSHIVYMGAQLDLTADGPHLAFPDDDRGLRSVRDLESLKSTTPGLKLFLSLPVAEAWGLDEYNTTLVQADGLATRLAIWLPQHGFDGVELHWDRLPIQKKIHYTRIAKLLRTTLKKAGFQLMVSVHPKRSTAYDIEALYRLCDFLIVHPFAQEDKPKVAVPPIIFKEDLVELCEVSLSQLRNKHRVILALPLFGYAYRLRSIAHYEVRAPVRGPATQGPYTDIRGALAYFEICFEFTADIWVSLYDREADCKIAVNRDKSQWIGYDNKASILNKVLYAKRQRMGGVAVFTVDMDDYDGDCGQKNVLLNQVYNAVREMDRQPQVPPSPTSSPMTRRQPTKETTTSGPPQ